MYDGVTTDGSSRGPVRATLCSLSLLLAPALGGVANAADGLTYIQHNLVSDGFIAADHTDPHLINPWGIVFGPTAPVWVSNQGSDTSTLYDGLGNLLPPGAPLIVAIPRDNELPPVHGPAGIVATQGTAGQFVVTENGVSAPAAFIFSTLDGTIDGWAPSVDATNAITVVDQSLTGAGAVFTGIALANNGTATLLYAADFGNARISVFDTNFKPVTLAANAFTDPRIPASSAPFSIHNIGGALYVAYAPKDRAPGLGHGAIDVFDTAGNLIKRFTASGFLNNPWAVTLAPADFGIFSNHILVGNSGNGTILAFDPERGQFDGFVLGANHKPLVIDGLLDLEFGNGLRNQPTNALFFSSGPGKQLHGLYGTLTPAMSTKPGDDYY